MRWHDERRQKLFASHPAVRALIGRNPWSALLVVAVVALQLSLSVALSTQPWWVVLLAAYLVGSFIAHALGVLIHEATHDLIFASPLANRWVAMLANVPLVFPAAMDFREKHLKHHAHLGEPDGADTQAPKEWEFRLATTPARTLLWLAIGPVWAWPARSRWVALNAAVQLMGVLPFSLAFGWRALVFLGASGIFAFAPHPVGVRRYGEHLTLKEDQPTCSYYGPLNWLSLNVGYHVEHHDLPNVPWNNLRRLKALAPELYDHLAFIPSWSALLWRMATARDEGPPRYFLEGRHQLASKFAPETSPLRS